MDRFHREFTLDTPTGKTCTFCQQLDLDFARRNPLDQLVKDAPNAAGHITEEGYVRHRLMELKLLKVRAFRKPAGRVA